MGRAVAGLGLAGALVASAAPVAATAPEEFSAARALEHVRALAERIGPRKTGTHQEREARDYVASEMERLGLRVRRAAVPRSGASVVGSENVIGTLEGEVPDVILIGSHVDSSATTVPGANDDASAVGVMLEAARVLSADPPVATVIFACFCAEEEGLLGSRHFASTHDLSRIRVVLNMDPVGQREIFVSPFPVAPSLWASRALAAVARESGIAGVIHDPLYLLVTRSITVPFGADHEPFLEKGVPALSLSDRFRIWTYHTVEDRAEWIDPETLRAAGQAIVGLVRRFDQAPPAPPAGSDDATYVILPLAGRPLFFVTPAIRVLAALVIVLAALWWRSVWRKAARRGARLTRSDVARALARAGLPLAGLIAGALASEALSQAMTGFRFSWTCRQGIHLAQAGGWAIAGLAGGWLIASGRRRPEEPETYTVASAAASGALGLVPLLLGRADIGFYYLLPSAATLGAATLGPRLTGAGALIGSLPLLALVTPRNYADAVSFVNLSPPAWIAGPAALVLLMPLALGLARSFDAPSSRKALARLMAGGALLGTALLVVNATGPSYDRLHRRVIKVFASVDLTRPEEGRATVRLVSAEHLRGVRTSLAELPLIHRRSREHMIAAPIPEGLAEGARPVVTLDPVEESPDGSVRDLRVLGFPPAAADRTRITIRSTEPLRLLDEGIWVTRHEIVRRHVYADEAPGDTFRLAGRPGQTIEVELRMELAQDVLGLELSADETVFQWLTTLTWRGSLVF